MSDLIHDEIIINKGIVTPKEFRLDTVLYIKLYNTGSFIIYIEKCNEDNIFNILTNKKLFTRIYKKVVFNNIIISKEIIPIIKKLLFGSRLFIPDVENIISLINYDKNNTITIKNYKDKLISQIYSNNNQSTNLSEIDKLINEF